MPSTILSDNGVTSGTSGIKTTGSNDGTLALQTTTAGGAATTAVTIDTSQNVGIGTTSPATKLEVASPASTPVVLRLASNKTGTGAGDKGRLDFYSADNSGAAYQLGYMDYDRSDGTATASYIAWANRKSSTVSESMRIDSSGNLLVGTTSNLSGVNGFQVSKNAGVASYAGAIVNTKTDNATVTNGFLVKYTGVSPSDGNYMFLCQDSGNTNRFYVTNAGGTGGTSDANLKKNIETTRDGYAEDLCKIRIVKYNWKEQSDDTPKDLGWIAQEVEQVFPRMIKTDADTGIKSVTHSAFVPMLIKAIQELKAINDTQAETINALTARIVALETVCQQS
jgi:hypothetical protein